MFEWARVHLISPFITVLVERATDMLLPIMAIGFLVAVVLRVINYYTLKRQEFFTSEFNLRIDRYMENIEEHDTVSFFVTAKRLLLITYYEIFEVTALLQRRRPDMIMTWSDRVFLTKQGFAWLVKHTMKQIRFIKHEKNHNPHFLDVSKNVFQNNPCFTKIFGYIPSGFANDFLNILPGMFIIAGIFGTFLGIMQALPTLSQIDPQDVAGAKELMDTFLLEIAFAMSTSILGIVFSLAMSMINTAFSAERIFLRTVENYQTGLSILWNRSNTNDIPDNSLTFDEHKNPLEALAEEALNKEYAKMRQGILKEAPKKKGPEKPKVPKAG